ncbi:hypothetical protein [Saccharopolyspora mangrovi]|uniref:Glycosyltransferase RgtA/B/C/D-like domain-containing protein n=1 Tax=Saccharopolyspora mangrovi TaxID=3082379 RepID=A0ABU6ADR0_9PSEU|nr:hypothetical protein [Saccharopolyspora sp. S2-29]MEB3369613.1 hypothetical protein [Saccharopolyspora sp. S2-29]
MSDDAMITLTYARNLAEHGVWGALPGVTANTQSSPLNMWLLAAGGVLTDGHVVTAAGLVLAAAFAMTGWWTQRLRRTLGLHSAAPYVALTLLACSPLLASTVGLETYLGVAALTGVARYAVEGRVVGVAVLAGLALLTRLDLVVPAAMLIFGMLPWRRWLSVAVIGAMVVAPWHLWSWFALGGAVPDTTWLKSNSGSSFTMVTSVGSFYTALWPVATVLTALPVLTGLMCGVWALIRRDRRARVVLVVLAAGWAHWVVMLLGEAYPQFWYFAPLVICSILATALTPYRSTWLGATAMTVALVLATGSLAASFPVPWTMGYLTGNYARTAQYAAVAADLGRLTGGQPVASPGEVGALAFHASVPVVDYLTDPAVTQPLLEERYNAAGPLKQTLLRWNWAHREVVPPAQPLRYRLVFPGPVPVPGREVARWELLDSAERPRTLVLVDTVP